MFQSYTVHVMSYAVCQYTCVCQQIKIVENSPYLPNFDAGAPGQSTGSHDNSWRGYWAGNLEPFFFSLRWADGK